MTGDEATIRVTEIAKRRPFTLDDLKELVEVMIEWRGGGWSLPTNITIGVFRVDLLAQLVKSVAQNVSVKVSK